MSDVRSRPVRKRPANGNPEQHVEEHEACSRIMSRPAKAEPLKHDPAAQLHAERPVHKRPASVLPEQYVEEHEICPRVIK